MPDAAGQKKCGLWRQSGRGAHGQGDDQDKQDAQQMHIEPPVA